MPFSFKTKGMTNDSNKMWGGRFSGKPADIMEQINASIDQAALKTSTDDQNHDLNPAEVYTFTLAGATYSFTPRVKGESTDIELANTDVTTDYASFVTFTNTQIVF